MANPNWIRGVSGNPNGRPRSPEVQLFRDALSKVEKEAKMSLIEYAVRKAYKDDAVLIALLKKILPDLVLNTLGGEVKTDYSDSVKQLFADISTRISGLVPKTGTAGSDVSKVTDLPAKN